MVEIYGNAIKRWNKPRFAKGGIVHQKSDEELPIRLNNGERVITNAERLHMIAIVNNITNDLVINSHRFDVAIK